MTQEQQEKRKKRASFLNTQRTCLINKSQNDVCDSICLSCAAHVFVSPSLSHNLTQSDKAESPAVRAERTESDTENSLSLETSSDRGESPKGLKMVRLHCDGVWTSSLVQKASTPMHPLACKLIKSTAPFKLNACRHVNFAVIYRSVTLFCPLLRFCRFTVNLQLTLQIWRWHLIQHK